MESGCDNLCYDLLLASQAKFFLILFFFSCIKALKKAFNVYNNFIQLAIAIFGSHAYHDRLFHITDGKILCTIYLCNSIDEKAFICGR